MTVRPITRDEFTRLSRNGGFIHVDQIPDSVRRSLAAEGITESDLQSIAGQDHIIRGEAEFRRLFTRLDSLDRDGRSTTITTEDDRHRPTQSGRAYALLSAEIERNRLRAQSEGGLRFAGDATLTRVAAGTAMLQPGDTGESVRRVQQALIDVGALDTAHGVTGTYDAATVAAVRRFQRETGIGIDGKVGAETLSALTSAAPPPGQTTMRSAEYDRLYADGRLDMTIAIGYDDDRGHEGTERAVLSGLRARGFQPIDVSNPAERARYGIDGDRFDPNARWFARTFHDAQSGRDITAVVRVITPGTDGPAARASFLQAMRQDEVVMYNGHARYGTGPDFDSINSGAGNFVIDPHGNRTHEAPPTGLRNSIRGRDSDLRTLTPPPGYQLLIFDGCNTEEYLHNMRDPRIFNSSMVDTDIIATQEGPRFMWTGQPALRFLDGLTSRESNNSMFAGQRTIERAWLGANGYAREVPEADHTFVESGFLGNDANRRVPSP